jgi:AhpD family alkylhydroperoxidase
MDEKSKELIAIGASIGAHCQPCLTYHVGKAKEMGIDEVAIREAMAIGHMVEKGAMVAMKQFAAGVFDTTTPAKSAPSCCKVGKSRGKRCGA